MIGQFANELKSSIEVAFSEKERSMFQEEEMHRAEDEWMDITERKIFVSGTFTSRDTQAIEEIQKRLRILDSPQVAFRN